MNRAVLLAVAASAGWAGVLPLRGQVVTERGARVDPTAAIRVYALAGQVTVHGWDRDSVHLVTSAAAGTRVHAGGTRTAYKVNTYEGIPERVPVVQIRMYVPREAQLWIKTTSAPIVARDVRGSVDLYTIEGSVTATGTPRELRIETMRGTVDISGDPTWLRVRSGTGDVRFTGRAMDLDISSVSGGITTTAGRQRGRVETVRGEVRLTSAPAPRGMMEVDSHSGSVFSSATPTGNAQYIAFTATGRIRNALTQDRPVDVSNVGRELRVTVGRGEARVTIRTFSGSVQLGR